MNMKAVSVVRTLIVGLTFCGIACVWAVAGARQESSSTAGAARMALQGNAAWAELERRGETASVIAAVEHARYEARPVAGESGTVTLDNPEQGLRAVVAPDAVLLRAGNAAVRLQPVGVGYGAALQPMTHIATRTGPARVEMDRTSHITEWWINRSTGLEQGFTLRKAPAGAADGQWLRVSLAVDGDLTPQVAADGQSATFVAADGSVQLHYDHLVSSDATGRVLPTRMRTDGSMLWLETDDSRAVYPVTVDPTFTVPVWGRRGYLKASNTGAVDHFGYSVSMSGDTLVVGAYQEDGSTDESFDSGAAYVFVRFGNTWIPQAYLKAPNPDFYDYFGWSVSVSGDTIAVGAMLEDGSGTGVDPSPNEEAQDAGAVYVFTRSGTTWSQQAYLKPSNTEAFDFFGWSVAVSGDTLVVGSLLEDGNGTNVDPGSNEDAADAGAAYVFVRGGTTWSQQAYLKASNTDANDQFGMSVALNGDTAVVSAVGEDGSGTGVNPGSNNTAADAGAAYVYVRSGGTWTPQAYLKASNTGATDLFGWSVSVDADTIVVGAGQEDGSGAGVNPASDEGAIDAGAAYVFVRSGANWSQQAYLKASNPQTEDWFGVSVGLDGDTIVVGAYLEDGSGTGVDPASNELAGAAGAAYVFSRGGSTWSQQAYFKAANAAFIDYFGISVAVSGDQIVVGAYQEDGGGTGVNPPQDDNQIDAGAVYVFGPPTLPTPPINVVGTPGNGQVSVAFAPPADDGGIPILSYTVTAAPGGATGTGATSPIVVTGLTNGSPYTFSVTATNEVGQSSPSVSSASVIPRTVPGPPTDASATGGTGQATVSFTPPLSNGGSAITGYTVISNPAGGVDSNAGTLPTTHVVTGLSGGVAYTFTVVATNAAGSSAPSAPSNSVTPVSVPGAPTSVTATAGNRRAKVSFVAPASDGGSPITGYTVTSNPAGGVDSNAGSTATTHVITGLTNGTAYTFTVVATNAIGSSAASAASNSVTPIDPAQVDLNGDGRGDAFLYDFATGAWSRQLSQAAGGFTQQSSGSWDPGWLIVPARFNADALTDFFLVNETSGQWFKMLNNGAGGFTAQATGGWWPGWERYVMDLNGDGISDVFLYDPATGVWFKSVSVPDGFTYQQGGWNPNWEIYPMTLNADDFGDMFLIDRGTGRWFWVLGQDGPEFTYPVTETWFPGWQFYPGDFNGDGVSDILLHDPPTGTYFVATATGSGFTYVQGGWSLGWQPYVADFNADGMQDLFLHDPATGVWFQMLSDGAGNFTNAGGQTWSLGWNIHPTDLNADIRADIVLYDSATGVWYQARNLVNGSFTYSSGSWDPGLTVITRVPIR